MDPNSRVNLQYSIAFKELPDEVDRLLYKAVDEIEEAACTLAPSIKATNQTDKLSLKACEEIQELRVRLNAALCTLEDVENIIHGYITHQAQPPAPEASPAPPPSREDINPLATNNAMEELTKKLQLFHQQALVDDNEEPHTTQGK